MALILPDFGIKKEKKLILPSEKEVPKVSETPKIQTPVTGSRLGTLLETPKIETPEFTFPVSELRTAPPEIEKKETFWTKAAKILLPKALEMKFGLTKPTIGETMMEQEKAREKY